MNAAAVKKGRRQLPPAIAAACALGAGCGVDFSYLIPAAAGQLRLLRDAVPIGQVIDGDTLTDAQIAKLRLIEDARSYACDVLVLNVDNNFTRFYDSGGEPVVFNVSASRKDRFQPRLWQFPVVGTVPYLGYFDRSLAEAKREELRREGLDVFMYEVDAYSGIGVIPNLVLSPMLERSDIGLLDTVFHELLHSTVWRQNDTSFNESLATFYGRAGTLAYLADRFPDRPEFLEAASQSFEDSDRFNAFMLELYDELDVFYSSDRTSDEKLSGREAVYQAGRDRFVAEVLPLMHRPDAYAWVGDLPANNAYMLGIRRYHLDLDIFEQVLAAAGEDWSAAREVFRAAAERSDPYAFLADWVSSPEPTAQVRWTGDRQAAPDE
jgi:predicted aminopeptidase